MQFIKGETVTQEQEKDKDNNAENINDSSGFPSDDVALTGKSFNLDDEELSDENADAPRKVPYFFIFGILIFALLIFCGIGYASIYLMNSDKAESVSISGNINGLSPTQNTTQEVILGSELPNLTAESSRPLVIEPPLPIKTSEEYAIEPMGKISLSNDPRIDELEDSLSNLNIKVDKILLNQEKLLIEFDEKVNDLNRKGKQNTDDLRNELNGLLIGIDTIATHIKMQSVKVESVAKSVEADSQEKIIRAASPSFSVRAKSIWGEVVYLTVSTDQNFQQQVTVGQKVAGWTLLKVDLNAKKSYWQHDNGKRNEITIP